MSKANGELGKKLAKEPARHIWLAGLGARAAALEKRSAHDRQTADETYRQLVARGLKLEDWLSKMSTEAFHRLALDVSVHEVLSEIRADESGQKLSGTEPAAPETSQLRRNAEARRAFLAEFGTLTSAEVASLASSRARNRAALANRWRAEGRIFAVQAGGQVLFPAFQFSDDDARPRPVIAATLALFKDRLSDWQTALWFTGRNGWIGARRPVDLLASDPEAVVEAAHQEATAFD